MSYQQNNNITIKGYTYYFTWVEDSGLWRPDGPSWAPSSGELKYTQKITLDGATLINGGGNKLYGDYYVAGYNPSTQRVLVTNSPTTTANTGYISIDDMPTGYVTITVYSYASGFQPEANDNITAGGYFRLGETTHNIAYNGSFSCAGAGAVAPNGYDFLNLGSGSIGPGWIEYPHNHIFTDIQQPINIDYSYGPVIYNITYDTAGGALIAANPSTYTVLSGVSFENAPTRAGYTFDGWYLDDKKITGINEGVTNNFGTSDELYSTLEQRTTGDLTVTARWIPNIYKITYDENGGTAVSDKNYTAADTFQLADAPTRTGYMFIGWELSYDVGSWAATVYSANQQIMAGNYGDAHLVAQWKQNTYKIQYLSDQKCNDLPEDTIKTCDVPLHLSKLPDVNNEYHFTVTLKTNINGTILSEVQVTSKETICHTQWVSSATENVYEYIESSQLEFNENNDTVLTAKWESIFEYEPYELPNKDIAIDGYQFLYYTENDQKVDNLYIGEIQSNREFVAHYEPCLMSVQYTVIDNDCVFCLKHYGDNKLNLDIGIGTSLLHTSVNTWKRLITGLVDNEVIIDKDKHKIYNNNKVFYHFKLYDTDNTQCAYCCISGKRTLNEDDVNYYVEDIENFDVKYLEELYIKQIENSAI